MKKLIVAGMLAIVVAFCPVMQPCSAGTENTEVIILENGVYFNGKTFEPFAEIMLKNGKIISISDKASKVKATRISVAGKFLIPGLIDAHVHIGGSPATPYVQADDKGNVTSAVNCGVTTMIDLFYTEADFKEAKKATAADPQHYSTLIMSGPILTAPGGHGTEYGVPTRTMTTVEEARKITKEVINNGVDVIKLVYEGDTSHYIPSLTIDEVRAITEVAHSMHKKVFAHIDRAAQAVACAESGVDVIAHMPADSLTDAQLNILKAKRVVIIPTIVVLQSALTGHEKQYMSDSLLWKTANPAYLENFKAEKLSAELNSKVLVHKYFGEVNFYANLRGCIKKGIPLLAGTDAGNYAVFYGYSLHKEIREYVLAGMSPADALCAATQNLALVLPEVKTGKIEAGYDADLVVLNANPLEDIGNTTKINMVFHKGMRAEMLPFTKVEVPPVKPEPYDAAIFDLKPSDALPMNIMVFSDAAMGGKSDVKAELVADAAGPTNLHMTGKVVKTGFMGFAGVGMSLTTQPTGPAVDISDYKAIEFEVKGNGEKYRISLNSSLVKDYNFHSAGFGTGGNWTTVKIPFTDLKQNPFYGKQIPLDLKTIASVSFMAMGGDQVVDVSVRGIHFVK